jgi:hypothetical protein
MNSSLKFVFALAVSGFMIPQSSVASEPSNVQIIIHSVTVRSMEQDGHAVSFLPTDSVDVIKTEGENSLVKSLNVVNKYSINPDEATWIPNKYLVGISAFKPLSIWHGQSEFEYSAGDFSETYYFESNGTFQLDRPEQKSQYGRLYKVGNVIWARGKGITSKNIGDDTGSMFWLKHDGTLCSPSLTSCEEP